MVMDPRDDGGFQRQERPTKGFYRAVRWLLPFAVGVWAGVLIAVFVVAC